MGSGRIHLRILKESVDVRSGTCQRFGDSGEVPADWKLANVTAVYKDMKKVPGSYRPVSLISVCRNFMGKVIMGAVETHLEINAILRHIQHGFKKGKSSLINSISLYDKVTYRVDEGEVMM